MQAMTFPVIVIETVCNDVIELAIASFKFSEDGKGDQIGKLDQS